jgi:UPF0755 protein
VVVTIRKSDDASDVARKLARADLINSETYFKTVLRFVDRDIKPATYTLRRGMSTRTIVDLITTEKSVAVTERKELTLTVIEGWRVEQIAEELDKIGYVPGGRAFLDATRNYTNDDFDFLADRPNKRSLEGYLFPDTYTIISTESPNAVIEKLLANFDAKFSPELRQRAAEMNLTVHQVLTFAALVEREAGNDRERPVIADVYISRWEQGITLDADPAVRYAIGKRDGDWWTGLTANDLETVDSPYNLYRNADLPPGPICNPGIASIMGVLQPTSTGYLYFVAMPDGSGHFFAFDFDGQSQNVAYVTDQADTPAYCADPWAEGCPLGATADTSTDGETVPIEQSDGT